MKSTKPALSIYLRRYLGKRLLAFALIFIVATSFYIWMLLYHNIQRTQHFQALSISGYVNTYLQSSMKTLDYLSHFRMKSDFNSMLMIYMQQNDLFQQLLILDRESNITSAFPPLDSFLDYSRMIPYRDNNGTRISAPYITPQNGSLTVSIAVSAENGDSIVGELNLQALQDYISKLANIQQGDLIFVVDTYGNVIAHPDPMVLARQSNYGHLEPVKIAIAGSRGYIGIYEKAGRRYLFSAEAIPGGKWFILSAWPVSVHLIRLFGSTGLSASLFIIFILAASLLLDRAINRDVVKPIEEFSADISSLPGGLVSQNKNSHVFAELEELRSCFDEMSQTIQERELSLLENKTRLASILDSLDALVCVSDALSGEILFVNKAGLELHQQTGQETALDFIREDERTRLLPSRIWEAEDTQSGKWFHCRRITSSWNDGSTVHITFAADISEQKLMEGQLRQSQKMEAVGTLAGGVAHDFNNILQAINGFTQLILSGKEEEDPDYPNLVQIFKSGQRAASLVRQLLAFSRKMEPDKTPIDMNAEIRDTISILQHTIPKMIHIETTLYPELHPVNADPAQMQQILLNLGSNAADAMPEGGSLIFETANTTLDETYCREHLGCSPGAYILLSVTDTGMGMDIQTSEKVFDPFFTTKEVGKGTGLGLASVYGVVKNHGGNIFCYSEEGKGTSFKMYLPAMQNGTLEQTPPDQDIQPGKGSEHILVVDDEETIRTLTKRMLERFGYRVSTAESGEEALQWYKEAHPTVDLIVLDLNMPGMSGFACMEQLRSIRKDAAILVASGYSTTGHAASALDSGADGFLGKPYQLKELGVKIREVLDR